MNEAGDIGACSGSTIVGADREKTVHNQQCSTWNDQAVYDCIRPMGPSVCECRLRTSAVNVRSELASEINQKDA